MSELKKLIALSALFIAGWCIFRWLPVDNSWHFWPFAFWNAAKGSWEAGTEPRLLWVYAIYLLALVTMIEGSWKIVPTMLVGFGVGLGLCLGAFYFASPYPIQWEDWSVFIGVGCNLAVLAGATRLIRKRHAASRDVSDLTVVLQLCLGTAVFLCGGWVGRLSEFFMHYLRAEIVGLFSVTASVLGLWLIVRTLRSPAAEMNGRVEGVASAIAGSVVNPN